ncbi:molybdopterin molybdotransferase MoeA [Lampropedia puyangensis]|uniref:Molybdopterin molybdenumtransferase n=1 Tax=Lampropedia puyangensis TaxID=1330072 RepID=A0A4S8FAF6_9BURK|nr:gephyrin-like molybdotransferase Glp [Lampropedia puyangensis]THU04553.1 molybdopterin molybdotransferase MoeA [Lampropedia puyangensis]
MANDLLDYHDALHTLLETHTPLQRHEDVALAALNHRMLAQDVAVQHNVPEFDNSAMDGYAINGNALTQWHVVHRIAAGDAGASLTLQPGQAARIFTGAPVPQGTTAVVMQEKVTHNDAADTNGGPTHIHLQAGETIQDGQHIRRRAEELRAGDVLLTADQRITPATIGLLAGQGYTHACVHAQVRVTVFSSGNELVPPGQPLGPGQIYDSNRIMLIAWLQSLGYAVTDGGNLPDQLAPTREALARAAGESDAIVCSGGVSVGEEDHLKNALTEVGELIQWRLFIKPGKPFTWGRIDRPDHTCRVFMLPGNPVSSLVTFQQLALPAMQRLTGLSAEGARPMQWKAQAAFTRNKPEPRREFVRVTLTPNRGDSPGQWHVRPVAQQGSNMLSGAVHANALAEVPPGMLVQEGDTLTVYPLFNQI